MIYKRVFTLQDSTPTEKENALEEIATYLENFGFIFEKKAIDSWYLRHVDSQAIMSIDFPGYTQFEYDAGYELNVYGYLDPLTLIPQQRRIIKATNTVSGISQLQCIVGSDDKDNMWITFSGYDSIDNIEGGVIAILGKKGINTISRDVFEGSNTELGKATPFISDFVAEKDKTHISDVGVVSGNIIRETLPHMKSYASSEIRAYRFYTINGKKYLALPGRLLIEC